MESAVFPFESTLGVYLLIGVLLLYPMHRYALPRIDASADGASRGFRMVVTPGLVALWPVILFKWSAARRGRDPHGSPDHPVPSLRIRRLQSLLVKLFAIALPLLLAAALYTRPAPAAPSDVPSPETADVR